MKKTNVIFSYSEGKGNHTGLGKNSDQVLTANMILAIQKQLKKIGTKGFRICFHLDGVVYSILIDIESGLQRIKVNADGTAHLFAPISRTQAVEMSKTAYQIGTFEELESIKEKGSNGKPFKNYGIAVEYQLARKLKKSFFHHKPWYEGSEFEGYEVKFFDFGNGKASSAPRAQFTSKKQLEKIGYSF